MILRSAFQALALKLQEAYDALGANDVRTRLGDCIRSHFRGSGTWGYYLDHFGDDTSGDVIYSSDSDVYRTTYAIEPAAGGAAAKCTVDFEGPVKVVPRTVYELDAEEAAHYATMEESLKTEKLYTELPIYERRITKAEREAASADDFAGKGRSFPILKRGDIDPAINSMARAGASNHTEKVLKGRIAAIAKRKGWESALPKSWRSEKTSEAAPPAAVEGAIALKESAAFPIDIVLSEALTPGKKIKLIAPGKGSTAYYTAEALKQAAADKVFKAGTPMRIDHPTMAEEAARPEGSVKDWGAVLAMDAYWLDEHAEGPGLFSEIKPFSDHATLIQEKAPYAGVSIRANGFAVMEGGKPLLREGVPVLSKFTFAEGVDMVTRAGAGGMFLSEAAIPAAIPPTEGGAQMDAAELKKIQESQATLAATNARLLERALRADARELAASILLPLTLHEAIKGEVVTNVLKGPLPLVEATGEIDTVKWTELVNVEAKRLGELAAKLTGSGRPAGMGATAPVVPIDAKESERRVAEHKRLRESAVRNFMDMGQSQAAAEASADRMLSEEVAC